MAGFRMHYLLFYFSLACHPCCLAIEDDMKRYWFTAGVMLAPPLLQYTSAASTPIPPSQDPFYTTPPHFETYSPGAVLRVRTAHGDFSNAIANCSAAYHIVYRTTDTRYRPSWAVTTLLLPTSYSPSTAAPLLSYQYPYNSPSPDASPSFDGPALFVPGSPVPAALGRGWLVVVPDFEGPTASFGAGVQAGHAVLDSVRAVLLLSRDRQRLGPPLGAVARYAMWGYSGGSIASEFAAELAVQYAPELAFAGAALGGVVPNLTSVLERINGSPYVGDTFAVMAGSLNQYPDAYDLLVGSLKVQGPYNKTGFLAVREMNISEAFAAYAGQDAFKYFVQGRDILKAPLIQKVFHSNAVMGYHGVPQMPLFVYKAIGDRFSSVEDTDGLVGRYCGIGATILYQRNTVGGHLAEIPNGVPRAMDWLVGVLEGTSGPASGCDVQTVTVNISSIPDF